MMVGPFLLLMVLPKLINTQDPDTQKVEITKIILKYSLLGGLR